MSRKALGVYVGIALSIMAMLLIDACVEDRLLSPDGGDSDAEYTVFYGGAEAAPPTGYYTYGISTKTGEPIDTFVFEMPSYRKVIFSNDGSNIIMSRSWLKIIDYESKEVIAENNQYATHCARLNATGDLLLVSDGYPFVVFSYPDLTPILVEDITVSYGGFLPQDRHAFYIKNGKDSLYVLNFTDPDNVLTSQHYIGGSVMAAEVTPDGAKLVILQTFYGDPKSNIKVYNTNDFALEEELEIPDRFYGGMTIHPDGNRIFLHQAAPSAQYISLIDVYSIDANTISGFITQDDIDSPHQFYPTQIAFTPDGRNAVILSFYPMSSTSTLIITDALSKAIIIQLDSPPAGAECIAVRPVDISK